MNRVVRRSVQVIAALATVLVGIVALALIVSQTPWFRDGVRGYVVQQANRALEGELQIGRMTGNLLFGIGLDDVSVMLDGERIVSIDRIEANYNALSLVTGDILIDRLRLERPVVRLEETEERWNILRLVRREEPPDVEPDPFERPITLERIAVADGALTIDGEIAGDAVRVPDRIDSLHIRGAFAYEPARYTVDLEHLSFVGKSPAFTLEELAGTIAVREDTLHLDELTVRTAESRVDLDGLIARYTTEPAYEMTVVSERLSFPEIGRLVPALAQVRLTPAFEVALEGPAHRLAADLDFRSAAGNVAGPVTLDITGPRRTAAGEVQVQALDLGLLLDDPEQTSEITGRARFDLAFPDPDPIGQIEGTYHFTGPRVRAAGYEATSVDVEGRLDGPRITIDARADAYAGRVTAAGTIVRPDDRRPLAFDLRGDATGIDLRRMPAQLDIPRVESEIDAAQYHVQGRGPSISGRVTLAASRFAGARIADGTVAAFALEDDTVTYSARGQIADLDLQRIGQAFDIEPLADERYASRLAGPFDVSGRGTDLAGLWLEASGELHDSEMMDGRLPQLAYEARLADGTLDLQTRGRFEDFDPEVLAGQPTLQGHVSGTVDVHLVIPGLGDEELDLERMTAAGRVSLDPSTIGDIAIDHAFVDGAYADRVLRLAELQVGSPDVRAQASGTLVLDDTGESDLEYRVQRLDLEAIGKLMEQPLQGDVALEGRMAGNLRRLTTAGTLEGSGVAYAEHQALDITSQYEVSVPELDPAQAAVRAKTEATFLTMAGREVNELAAIVHYQGERLEFDARVQHEAHELEAAGTLVLYPDHQEIHLPRLFVRAEEAEWAMAPDADALIDYGADRLTIRDFRLVSAGQELRVDGMLALAPDAVVAEPLEVQATNVDLEVIDTLLLLDRGLAGRLDASVSLTGSIDVPVVDARAEIRDGGFADYTYERLTADVQYRDEQMQVDARLQQTPAEWLRVSGLVPMTILEAAPPDMPDHIPPTERDRIDLRIESSEIGLAMVQGFTDQVQNVAGTMQVNLQVTGSGFDPHFSGFLDVRGGAFELPALGTAYRGLDTRLDLKDDVVHIRRFQLLDQNNDPMTIEGRLAAHERQLGEFDVLVRATRFEILNSELGDVDINTDLRITGELRRPRIVGDVSVHAGRVEVDRVLQLVSSPYAADPEVLPVPPDVGWATRPPPTLPVDDRVPEVPPPADAEEPETPMLFDALAMDVRLRVPQNLVLRGTDLRAGDIPIGLGNINITVGGDVRAQKETREPLRLTGDIVTVRGHYDFQRRRFEILRGGTIRFVGLEEIDPLLIDIRARRVIQGVEATVEIGGTLREPELTLTSNPALDEGDILALIVFNRPLNQLAEGDRLTVRQRAGALAAGFVAAPLADVIGEALNLDFFEIEPVLAEDGIDPRITVGQQFGDRLFVRFSQQFGAQEVSEFILEYRLADFLRLQTAIAETGGTGRALWRRVERSRVDLLFFFSY